MVYNLEETFLGIEFGSTRIKAVLIDKNHTPLVSSEHNWKNELVDGVWTYHDDNIWLGLQNTYQKLAQKFELKYSQKLNTVGSIGLSAMMHGYLPFNKEGKQLVPFRTWRNTITEESSKKLSGVFQFNIPQRWSISHLYQAILNEEEHVKDIDYLTTLAGYVHWKLTGQKVLGVGEAAGMFPIDSQTIDYNERMISQFNELIENHNFKWDLRSILPIVETAGTNAGYLTEEGAKLLDTSGVLQSGIQLCPPEGDAGTGMVATNSVMEHTGNVSAGTSIFSMVVLDKELSDYYVEIDMVTTPTGKPVAMIHCNNFTSDINNWISLFKEVLMLLGNDVEENDLYTRLYGEALKADFDVGKIFSSNYYTGEPITGFEEGRPLLVRMPDSKLTIANFMRSQIYSALATLKIGMDILIEEENITVDYLLGHGGFFKTKDVGQQILADALNTDIAVMDTAGEGGPWGMAILAAYSINKKENQTLADYLKNNVFSSQEASILNPNDYGVESFKQYMEHYEKILQIERAAVDNLD